MVPLIRAHRDLSIDCFKKSNIFGQKNKPLEKKHIRCQICVLAPLQNACFGGGTAEGVLSAAAERRPGGNGQDTRKHVFAPKNALRSRKAITPGIPTTACRRPVVQGGYRRYECQARFGNCTQRLIQPPGRYRASSLRSDPPPPLTPTNVSA